MQNALAMFCKVLIHKCGNKLERNIQEEVNNKEIVKGMIVLSLSANSMCLSTLN